MSEWFKDWFNSSEYLDVYSHRDKTDVANLLVLITRNYDFKSETKVLDAACGNGRFSNYFAKTGFNLTSFDLSMQLLKIAQKAGMTYLVITAKHHAGFSMFDSRVTDYDIMSAPYGKDILKELEQACRKNDFNFG